VLLLNNSNELIDRDLIQLKFVRLLDGKTFFVGNNLDWRFQKNGGLAGFADFSANLTYDDNYARDGGTTWHARLSKKDRTIKIVYLYPDKNVSARQALIEYFKYNYLYNVYITYMGREMYAEGRLYKMAISEETKTYKNIKCTMTFSFDNPFLKSVDNFGRDIAAVTPTTAFPYLAKLVKGKPTGIFNFQKTVVLYNDGDQISYPRVRIVATDQVWNPEIWINDNFIRFLDTIERNDEIDIDFTVIPPTVKLNGQNAIGKCDRESNFDGMYLSLGNNTIRFDAENGSDEMIVSVYFNKTYTVI
jgi:phage-related protein